MLGASGPRPGDPGWQAVRMGLLSQRSGSDEDPDQLALDGLEAIGGGGESTYDLSDWDDRALEVLRERLDTLAVPHEWEEETTLVVATEHEDWVERILDQVEDDLADTLDPNVPQVAYDLTGWSEEDRERLLGLLEEEAIPHALEDVELFAHEIDEQRVDELVDLVVAGEEAIPVDPSADDVDRMGPLYLAADLLVNEPLSPAAALALADARRDADGAVPYGVDRAWWRDVLAQADGLLAVLDTEPVDGDAVHERAEALRAALRPYV